MAKAAILGATGPTGIWLAKALLERGWEVRAVSRSSTNLRRAFGSLDVERVEGDLLEADATLRVSAGCDLLVNSIGLPLDHIEDHPTAARHVVAAMRQTGARGLHVSSFWAYLPVRRLPLNEDHPREGGNLPVRMRRQAEDIMQAAGAAVVHLPDFFGPEVHTSTIQNALREAVTRATISWPGSTEVAREYLFVPEGMRLVADLAAREEAWGRRWIIPGAGPLTLTDLQILVEGALDRPVKDRSAGPLMLRLLALGSPELRRFMPMMGHYVRPIRYDAGRLEQLLGPLGTTPYEHTVAATLEDLRRQHTSAI